jgi:outer membrane lipoprotein-sorting protein
MRKKGVVDPMQRIMIRPVAAAALAIAFTLTGVSAFAQQGGKETTAQYDQLSPIMDTWVQNSSRIKTLSARFSRKDRRPGFATRELIYDIRWKNSGLASLKIESTGPKDESEYLQRIVWTGRDVWQYEGDHKEIRVWTTEDLVQYDNFRKGIQGSWRGRFMGNEFDFIFPSLGNPNEIDPLPFFVGMDETVVKNQFKFKLTEGSDPNHPVVRATPIDPALKSTYDHILITLDSVRRLPIAVEYQRGWRGKDSRQYTLLAIELDRPIDDATFVPQKPKDSKIKSPVTSR